VRPVPSLGPRFTANGGWQPVGAMVARMAFGRLDL
jgi:hypothetical protein